MQEFTTIKLDKEYHLRLSYRSLAAFEELSGKSLADFAEGMSTTATFQLIFCALKAVKPDLTQDEAYELLDDNLTVSEITELGTALIMTGYPSEEKNASKSIAEKK